MYLESSRIFCSHLTCSKYMRIDSNYSSHGSEAFPLSTFPIELRQAPTPSLVLVSARAWARFFTNTANKQSRQPTTLINLIPKRTSSIV